ncbi:MAG: metallophosphoesterase [Clostridiaceae bacterium]|nr:metallophosphoesterase [Clostridiaceae bacterium]
MIFVAVAVALILFIILNFYIGLKGYYFFNTILPLPNKYIYWSIFIIIACSFILGQVGRRFMPESVAQFFEIVGSYWIAAFEFFIIIYILIDIFSFLVKLSGVSQGINSNKAVSLNLFILLFVIGILVYGTYHSKDTKIVKQQLTIAKKAGSIKELNIVMVSDIHLGEIIGTSRLTKMVNEINSLNPDIVLLAGDIIDNSIEPFKKYSMGQEFLKIKSKYGVYSVLGNHEYIGGNIKETESEYKKAGINCLIDETVKIADSFYILGRNDLSSSRGGDARKTLAELLVSTDKSLPIIVMDHQPSHLEEGEKNNIDLQFSGHTHSGQYFPNNLVTHLIFEKDWGFLKKGNSNFIVSSGYGTWGPPIRVGTDSEIINVVVNFKDVP